MLPKVLALFFLLVFSLGCSQLHTGRSYLSEMEHDDSSFFSPREDFAIVAGDTGRDWMSPGERRRRTPASEGEEFDGGSRFLKQELRTLESMQSEESAEFYQEHRHRLASVSERIFFLKLPPHERREYLVNRGFLPAPKPGVPTRERASAIQKNDVLLGMKKNDVLASLGKPVRVEVAGNPRNENERWLYRLNGNQKFIYFESGEVQGWE
jgi:hypothetical protein